MSMKKPSSGRSSSGPRGRSGRPVFELIRGSLRICRASAWRVTAQTGAPLGRLARTSGALARIR